MSIENILNARSNGKCELCEATTELSVFDVPPDTGANADKCVLVCKTCRGQIENPSQMDAQHWRCLSDSMWTPEPAVQVMAWRMLNRLNTESWAQDLLDMLYLDNETLAWAQDVNDAPGSDDAVKHLDSNGAVLETGDTVTLIKDLNVKGASFTAKRGTAVRNISLVPDNAAQIEGRISGQQIVILTEFVKKSA